MYLQIKYAHYEFAWYAFHEEEDYQCEEPGPAPLLECSGNGSIELAENEWEHHDCAFDEIDPSSIVCEAQPDVGNLVVRCYGSEPEDLKLTVTLPEVTAKCHGRGTYPYEYKQGYAQQIGLLSTYCGEGDEGKLLDMKIEDCLASTDNFHGIGLACHAQKWCKAEATIDQYCELALEKVVIT
eukprot:299846_1